MEHKKYQNFQNYHQLFYCCLYRISTLYGFKIVPKVKSAKVSFSNPQLKHQEYHFWTAQYLEIFDRKIFFIITIIKNIKL